MNLKLGERIRLIRIIKGLNRKEIASILDISVEAYRKIESGQTVITNFRLEQICDYLKVKPKKIQKLEQILAESIFKETEDEDEAKE
jgi:transcriptional regulator with XRE-family HTH domain